jgi:probable phosphoglycerate mutase
MKHNGEVLVARHGETESNRAGRYAGWCMESLTRLGREQAVELGYRLKDAGVTRVRTSCIRRAQETAALVGGVLGVPVLPDSRLNELRMGPWEGLTEAEVLERYPGEFRIWHEAPDELRLPDRETLRELAGRVQEVVATSMRSGHRELLMTHVALVRVATLAAYGRPLSEYKQIEVENCCLMPVPVPPTWIVPDRAQEVASVPAQRFATG